MKFIRGNDRINQLAQRADIAESVSRIRAEMDEADRTYDIGQRKRETENEEPTTQEPVFVRGNDHLDRLLSDPLLASNVAAAQAAADEMDRRA